jgi:hypothetical protein
MKRLDWRRPEAPPLLSFSQSQQLRHAIAAAPLDPGDRSSFEAEARRGILPVVCSHVLGTALGVSPGLILAMSAHPERYYRSFSIPKRSGGDRRIDTPRVFLKVVQWWILDRVVTPYSEANLPDPVCAFRPGRSIRDAALPHVGARFVVRFDLSDFFGHVSATMVESVYRQIGYTAGSCLLLTGLTTLAGALPQGAPTSPALANVAFSPCDSRLLRIALRYGMAYTRYADDLFFSGHELPSRRLLTHIAEAIGRHSFRVNKTKTRVMGPNERRAITGLVVSDRAQPPRKLRRALRARFHQAGRYPDKFVESAPSLLGWASYISMFDPVLGAKYHSVARIVQSRAQHA